MYSDWQAAAKARIHALTKDLPDETPLAERRRILRRAAHGFHGGTSWGKRVWSKHCRLYLMRHGLAPKPVESSPLFGPDIIFPYRQKADTQQASEGQREAET